MQQELKKATQPYSTPSFIKRAGSCKELLGRGGEEVTLEYRACHSSHDHNCGRG